MSEDSETAVRAGGWLATGDSKTRAYFPEVPGDPRAYVRTAVAFANRFGGHMVFGCGEDGMVTGPIDDVSQTATRLVETIRDNTNPPILADESFMNVGDRAVIVLDVVRHTDMPCFSTLDGNAYIRADIGDVEAEPGTLLDLHDGLYTWRYEKCLRVIDDVCELTREDTDAVGRILRAHGVDVPVIDFLTESRLVRIVDGVPKPTIALDLLTVNSMGIAVDCSMLREDRSIVSREFVGGALDQIDGVLDWTWDAVLSLWGDMDGRDRFRDAIREAIENAVMHRSYRHRTPVTVRVDPYCVTVRSPGTSPISLSERGVSLSRNGILYGCYLRLHGYGGRGKGLKEMFSACSECGLPEPIVYDGGNSVLVMLKREGGGFSRPL